MELDKPTCGARADPTAEEGVHLWHHVAMVVPADADEQLRRLLRSLKERQELTFDALSSRSISRGTAHSYITKAGHRRKRALLVELLRALGAAPEETQEALRLHAETRADGREPTDGDAYARSGADVCAPPETGATESDPVPRRCVDEWGPLALGVRPAWLVASPRSSDLLPPYVHRAHDDAVAAALAVAPGRAIVLAVGAAATGKTRTIYEAVRANPFLRTRALIMPRSPEHLVDECAAGRIPSDGVVWVDEMQHYLRGPLGETAALALQDLATTPGGMIVVGTMPAHAWDEVAVDDVTGPQARRLLLSHTRTVRVPHTVPGSVVADLAADSTADPRLRGAAQVSLQDREVVQVLACGEYLRQALQTPATEREWHVRAVVDALLHAYLLGVRAEIGRAYLDDVAAVYLDPAAGRPGSAWIEEGIRYAASPTPGFRGLTWVRGEAYGLSAFYVEAAPRRPIHHAPLAAPVWDALLAHVDDAADRLRLAEQAWRRGLFQMTGRFAASVAHLPEGKLTAAKVHVRAGRLEEAEALLRDAHAQGSAAAVVELAEHLRRSKRAAEGRELLLTAAGEGNVHALVSLYWKARDHDEAGVPGDDPDEWLRRGVKAGAPGAVVARWSSHNLDGEDLSTFARCAIETGSRWEVRAALNRLESLGRADEAEHWLWLAVAHGIGEANLLLANRLDAQNRTDLASDIRWQAVEADSSAAAEILQSMVVSGAPQDEVRRWLRHSLKLPGNLTFMLSKSFEENGRLDELEIVLRAAADEGIVGAAFQLAVFLSDRDVDASRRWMRESALRYEIGGMRELSDILHREGDAAGWEEWLRRASLVGDEGALLTLVFNLGRGTRADEAERLFRYGLEPDGTTAPPR